MGKRRVFDSLMHVPRQLPTLVSRGRYARCSRAAPNVPNVHKGRAGDAFIGRGVSLQGLRSTKVALWYEVSKYTHVLQSGTQRTFMQERTSLTLAYQPTSLCGRNSGLVEIDQWIVCTSTLSNLDDTRFHRLATGFG